MVKRLYRQKQGFQKGRTDRSLLKIERTHLILALRRKYNEFKRQCIIIFPRERVWEICFQLLLRNCPSKMRKISDNRVIGDWLKVSESWAATVDGWKASLATNQEEGRGKREFPLVYREFWIILCVNNKIISPAIGNADSKDKFSLFDRRLRFTKD